MTRPHFELSQIVVDPDQRNQGVAKLMLEWGIKQADELVVETVVVSVPFAVPIY
ncbi:hypothetical protein BCR34DRAFT_558260 [Clohesyomyces aquaticus]|uniref:N-acetyltransferase domain-containing protein n=1 Tax=Clohesyomyces aquaticus TaxID=1231657 RepID=A0A1Y2A066_9PLEO|nr:hypothetical protein BCR34DRAFT_558260 [Clohesyomyces aquaticus]